MLEFHCCIHREPVPLVRETITVDGGEWPTIKVSNPLQPLPVSFEGASASLREIDGLHFEPDGWFIWGAGAGDERWQVDGQLFDGGKLIEYVEMKGRCPSAAFDRLIAAFGGDQTKLALQLVAEGVYIELERAREFLAVA